jgi:hypothetical protein
MSSLKSKTRSAGIGSAFFCRSIISFLDSIRLRLPNKRSRCFSTERLRIFPSLWAQAGHFATQPPSFV